MWQTGSAVQCVSGVTGVVAVLQLSGVPPLHCTWPWSPHSVARRSRHPAAGHRQAHTHMTFCLHCFYWHSSPFLGTLIAIWYFACECMPLVGRIGRLAVTTSPLSTCCQLSSELGWAGLGWAELDALSMVTGHLGLRVIFHGSWSHSLQWSMPSSSLQSFKKHCRNCIYWFAIFHFQCVHVKNAITIECSVHWTSST